MSVSYGPLAERYDLLTSDVPYDALCDYYETALKRCGRAVRTVLDLGCGTGTLSLLLARRGYELIAADASPDMLSIFQSKLADLPEGVTPPMLLCQRAEEERHLDEDEFLNVFEAPLKDLVEDIMAGRITDGKTVCAILKAARIYGV